ncbi:MAG: insulinase family protein [Desulfobacteraceae bacterium]|nr:MAG: insulinase family protein [Desulfobacteraceae bacterium]
MRDNPAIKRVLSKKLISYFILALALCSGCARLHEPAKAPEIITADLSSIAAQDAIFNPTRQWAQETSDLKPDASVIYETLPNGFRYILMKNSRPESRVSMHLYIQAGSMHEAENERGIAHFLEHMLFNGSENFKPGELVKYFQGIGMKFGPDANAHTGFYNTVYDIDLPQGDRDGLEKGLFVLRDYAAGALLPEDEIDRERGIILAEKRTRDSADYRTFEASFNFELPDALLSKRLPIGTEEVLRKADRRLLKSFYDAWYRPGKMVLILVGDFEIPIATGVIKETFGTLSARGPAVAYQNPGVINHQGIKSFYHFEPEAGSTSVSIETISPKINPPDSAELQRQRLLSAMSNYILNNRLSELLEKPDTPFTSAVTNSGNYLNYLEGADISAECSPDNWKATLTILEQTLRKALTYGFTKSEIDRAKKTFISGLDQTVKTAATRESRNLANQIMLSLSGNRVFQSPAQKKELLAPFIETISANDLHLALKNDWAADHRLILVTGNTDLKNQPQPPENLIRAVYDASHRIALEKPLEKALIGFPYLPTPAQKGKIVHQETISDLGIVSVKFENNVHLLVKKTDFKANQVQAALVFGSGQSGEPEKSPGLALISQRVVNLSGLGHLTRDELKQALAGKNTGVIFQVDEDHFALAGESVTDEIPLMFQLYHAYLTDPGFRQDAMDLAIAQYAQEYDALSHSIDGGMMFQGARFLAGGDSRFGLPDIDTLKKHSLEDIRRWVKPALTTPPIEISVVGDLDVETVIDLAATYIGSLPARIDIQAMDKDRKPVFPKGDAITIPVPTVIPKGIVDVAFLTGDFRDNHRNRRLSALSEVISDRMRVKIREEMGAAYSSYAYNDPSRAYPGYGLLHNVVQTDPDQSDTIINAIKSILTDIANNGVFEDELQRAIRPILTSIRERIKTNPYWLGSVMKGSSRFPAQLDWCRSFETDYATITAQELTALTKQYLKETDAATVIIVPVPKPQKESIPEKDKG